MKLRHWEAKCFVQNYAVIIVSTRAEPCNSTSLAFFPNAPRRTNSFYHM